MNKLDWELVLAAKVGDHQAWTELVRMHESALRRHINSLLRYQPHEVDDIVQDTFMEAFEHIGDFDNESSFRTWLCSIASHLTYNHFRYMNRRPPLHDVPIEEVLNEDQVDDPDFRDIRDQLVQEFTNDVTPEEEYFAQELVSEILEMVDCLSDRQRDLFQLRFVEQREYHEIAEYLMTPIGTIKREIHELNLIVNDVVKDYKQA